VKRFLPLKVTPFVGILDEGESQRRAEFLTLEDAKWRAAYMRSVRK
jgi:hypothetical protein